MTKTYYTILLVEDEDIIRNGLITSVPWDNLGYTPITARHGKEALEIFNSQKIDIILTDIKMPFISGIELLQQVRQINIQIPIIILSGYDDFEYARQSLRLGASEYLLKPINMDDFIPLLRQFHNNLSITEKKALQQTMLKSEYTTILNALNTQTNYECIFPYLHSHLHFLFCKIQINNFKFFALYEDYLQLINRDNQFYDYFEAIISTYNILDIECQLGERILLISADSSLDIKNIISEICNICTRTNINLNIHAFFSSIKSNLADIGEAYSELIKTTNNHYVDYTNGYTHYKSISTDCPILPSNNISLNINFSEIEKLIVTNNTTLIIDWFITLQEHIIQKHQPTTIQSLIIATDIYHKLIALLKEKSTNISEDFLSPEASYSSLLKQTTLEGMFCVIYATTLDIANIIYYTEKKQFTDAFNIALAYVGEHYCEETLSLDEVSKKAGMGRCYLSAMFKQNMGQTFIEYVTELRMKKALHLMNDTPMMIYEIADEIGYQNATYFSTVFKKYYGISPKEYKTK
ncbi:MAG: response regulator [Eubacteriales bacterium]